VSSWLSDSHADLTRDVCQAVLTNIVRWLILRHHHMPVRGCPAHLCQAFSTQLDTGCRQLPQCQPALSPGVHGCRLDHYQLLQAVIIFPAANADDKGLCSGGGRLMRRSWPAAAAPAALWGDSGELAASVASITPSEVGSVAFPLLNNAPNKLDVHRQLGVAGNVSALAISPTLCPLPRQVTNNATSQCWYAARSLAMKRNTCSLGASKLLAFNSQHSTTIFFHVGTRYASLHKCLRTLLLLVSANIVTRIRHVEHFLTFCLKDGTIL
jgi:hypothetical protein